jgi:hypothetical protein
MYASLSIFDVVELRPSGHWFSSAGLLGSNAILTACIEVVLSGVGFGEGGRGRYSLGERYSPSSSVVGARVGEIGVVGGKECGEAVVNGYA